MEEDKMKRKTYIKKMRALLTDLYMDDNNWIDKKWINYFYKSLRICHPFDYANAYKGVYNAFKIP